LLFGFRVGGRLFQRWLVERRARVSKPGDSLHNLALPVGSVAHTTSDDDSTRNRRLHHPRLLHRAPSLAFRRHWRHLVVKTKIALVTGASSGLGAALAVELARRGWLVHAASRSGRAPAAASGRGRIRPLQLDVTAVDQVQHTVSALAAETGGIDLVINNAGINFSGVVEEVPLIRGAEIVETNFFGAVYVTRAALGSMRERRSGTILTIGSLAGLVAPPGEAYYAASKHALEGFMESLHYEVESFGIRVLLAEPGFIRTALATASPPIEAVHDAYERYRVALSAHWKEAIASGAHGHDVARRIVDWAERPGRAMRRRFGRDARWTLLAKRLVPEPLFFAITRKVFGI
jgi:NAD(P)-dependent dehydrogenase (short-subunit alcohol dehydrogenase family)